MKIGFISLTSSVFKGYKSTKRALLLFDKVVVPSTKKRIDVQIERFADGDKKVGKFLKKRLLPIDYLDKTYTELIDDLLKYFKEYYWENWLSPKFEKEVGEYHTATEANLAWAYSLKRDSRLLSNLIREEKQIESYCDFGIMNENTDNKYTSDGFLPDPAIFNWHDLVPILESDGISTLREKIWKGKNLNHSLSSDYFKDLEDFFNKTYPQDVDKNAIIVLSELLISLGTDLFGPAKSLHQIYKNRKVHNKYAWLSIIRKVRDMEKSKEENDDEIDEDMEDYLSLFPYG